MLRIWKDGGGRGPLPIEVERWDGVVREVYGEPMGVKEQTDAEKKVQLSSKHLAAVIEPQIDLFNVLELGYSSASIN